MLSLRLWRIIAEADIHDPIFRRVSQIQKPAAVRSLPRLKAPRLLWLVAPIALGLMLIMAPQLLALVMVAPIGMITLIVASPALLPVVIWLAGAFSTGEIISGIYRERRQHTYDLICASTQGRLKASWSFATGLLHRGGFFLPLRWGTRTSLRAGSAAFAGLTIATLVFALSGAANFGFAQLRLLTLPLIFMALYFTNMTQSFALSHIIGLLASSFDWTRRDALLVGLLGYGLLNSLPLFGAGLVYLPFRWLVFEPHALALLLVEALALLLIIAARELTIVALWSALKRRMNERLGEVGSSDVLRRDALFRAA